MTEEVERSAFHGASSLAGRGYSGRYIFAYLIEKLGNRKRAADMLEELGTGMIVPPDFYDGWDFVPNGWAINHPYDYERLKGGAR